MAAAGRRASRRSCSHGASSTAGRRIAAALRRRLGVRRGVRRRARTERRSASAPRVALIALTVYFARAIARRGLFGGDPTVADDRRRHRRPARDLHLLPGRQVRSSRRCSTTRAGSRPRSRRRRLLTADIWSVGCFGGGHALRRRDQFRAARDDRRRAARRCSASCSRSSCSAAASATRRCSS